MQQTNCTFMNEFLQGAALWFTIDVTSYVVGNKLTKKLFPRLIMKIFWIRLVLITLGILYASIAFYKGLSGDDFSAGGYAGTSAGHGILLLMTFYFSEDSLEEENP